jgi:hypothetical protein
MLRMPTIEEKDSEWEIKEEIERKDKEYLKRIALLEQEVETLHRKREEQEKIFTMLTKTYKGNELIS